MPVKLTDQELLYTNGDFVVATCVCKDPILQEDTYMYGIYNTITGVRESEVRRLANAKTVCDYLGDPPKKFFGDDVDVPVQGELKLN